MNKQCVNLELDKRHVENVQLESIVPERNLEGEERNAHPREFWTLIFFVRAQC